MLQNFSTWSTWQLHIFCILFKTKITTYTEIQTQKNFHTLQEKINMNFFLNIYDFRQSLGVYGNKTNDDNNSHSPFFPFYVFFFFGLCVNLSVYILELQSRNNIFIVILQIIFTNSLVFIWFFFRVRIGLVSKRKKKYR